MARWIRLDVTFDEGWLFVLAPAAQLAWVKLLCSCKKEGIRGRMKAKKHLVAARQWGIGEEDVVKMLQAAQDDGALALEGDEWVIVNWDEYQDSDYTTAERSQRYRERKRQANVTPRHAVTTVTHRDACRATETETLTETETEVNTPKPPKGAEWVLPTELNTPEFAEAWSKWVEYRTEIRHKLTKTTVERQFAMLVKVGPKAGAEMIYHSIEQGYRGLFAPDNRQRPQAKPEEYVTI